MKNKEFNVFSREPLAWDAGYFLQCAKLMRRWCIIQPKEVASQPEEMAKEWERRGALPPLLPWVHQVFPPLMNYVPDNQNDVEGSLISSVRSAVIGDSLFFNSEPVNSFALGTRLGLDLVSSAEPVNFVVSYE
jgi:hypothetical protein